MASGVKAERRMASFPSVPGTNSGDTRGGRANKSSSSLFNDGSPDGDVLPAELPEKPVPNYLKPTLSSCRGVCRHGRKHPPPDTGATKRSATNRRNTDKPPSSKPPTGSKERTLKDSRSLSKIAASPRPTQKAGEESVLTRVKSFPKRGIDVKKKEELGGSASSCGGMSDSDASNETSTAQLEQEEKDHVAADFLTDKEQGNVQNQMTVDPIGSDNVDEPIYSTPQAEEHSKQTQTPPESEFSKAETGSNEKKDGTKENDKHQHFETGEVPEQPSGGLIGEGVPKKTTTPVEGASNEEDESKENKGPTPRKGVQGKKESSPAYNDVVEETASKLVEKRKSKVKALVGSFETFISLQEPAPEAAGEPGEAVPLTVDDKTMKTESTPDAV